MIIETKKGLIQAVPGLFPTLISDDKREDGKQLGNRTKCIPRKVFSSERYIKTAEERKELKKAKKECVVFENKTILKV